MFGSLKNQFYDIDKKKSFSRISLIDSSTLENIGPEPSSYLLIKNSYLRTNKILKYFQKK